MSNFVVTDRVEVELAAIVKALAVDRVFVLVDENTAECCLSRVDLSEYNPFVIKIKAGDESKTIDAAVGIWEELVDNGATRSSLLVNLNEVSTGNAMQLAYNSEAEVWEWTAWEDGTSLEQMGLPFMVSGSYVSENLLGFNVYKDGIQLNTQMLENFTYTDTAGIVPSTEYCYVVEAVYANNVTASSAPTCVTTPLDPCVIISFPYEEYFDTYGTGTGTYPDCWSRYYSGTTTTYPYISSTYSHSSSGSLYLYAGSSYWVMGISPMLSPDIPMNSTYISFMLRKTTASHKMIVGVMDHPDSLSSFVAIDTISPSATSTWEEFTIFLDCGSFSSWIYIFVSGIN